MRTEPYSKDITAVRNNADGAVGVASADENWYVAIVRSRAEKIAAEQLRATGIDTYIATQEELHVWKNGRRKNVLRVVIPSIVFVRCTEARRREIVTMPCIQRFMVNRSASSGTLRSPLAIIPPMQMQRLMFMLGHAESPVQFTPTAYRAGDAVRVIRGQLRGLQGQILQDAEGAHILAIGLDLLGGATVHIDPSDVERI